MKEGGKDGQKEKRARRCLVIWKCGWHSPSLQREKEAKQKLEDDLSYKFYCLVETLKYIEAEGSVNQLW